MNKILLMVIMSMLIPLSAWAECVVYEYAEIKDMSKTEIEAAIDANKAEALDALQWGNKFLENGDRFSYGRQQRNYDVCEKQAEQLKRVQKKSYPENEPK